MRWIISAVVLMSLIVPARAFEFSGIVQSYVIHTFDTRNATVTCSNNCGTFDVTLVSTTGYNQFPPYDGDVPYVNATIYLSDGYTGYYYSMGSTYGPFAFGEDNFGNYLDVTPTYFTAYYGYGGEFLASYITTSPVPEISTWAMMLMGMAGLALFKIRAPQAALRRRWRHHRRLVEAGMHCAKLLVAAILAVPFFVYSCSIANADVTLTEMGSVSSYSTDVVDGNGIQFTSFCNHSCGYFSLVVCTLTSPSMFLAITLWELLQQMLSTFHLVYPVTPPAAYSRAAPM